MRWRVFIIVKDHVVASRNMHVVTKYIAWRVGYKAGWLVEPYMYWSYGFFFILLFFFGPLVTMSQGDRYFMYK